VTDVTHRGGYIQGERTGGFGVPLRAQAAVMRALASTVPSLDVMTNSS